MEFFLHDDSFRYVTYGEYDVLLEKCLGPENLQLNGKVNPKIYIC